MAIWAVIMAGGSGTRFWPLSRQMRPKQFLNIGTERPLIVETINRLKSLIDVNRCTVVAGQIHVEQLKACLPGVSDDRFIVEPCPRNTAPCIGLAAVHIARHDPNAVLVVLPADHHITDVTTYQNLVSRACELAEKGHIVTLGIKPNRPETGYGYIKLKGHIGTQTKFESDGLHDVDRFVEKPDLQTAKTYLESEQYLWNSGMFFFTAQTLLDAYATHLPEVSKGLSAIEAHLNSPHYWTELERAFTAMPSVSIDYGIMEPISEDEGDPKIKVLTADIGWNDVGHWGALSDYADVDDHGNVIQGRCVSVESGDNVVYADTSTVALLGVDNLVVVQTEDAILVCPRERAQDVRKIVSALRNSESEGLL